MAITNDHYVPPGVLAPRPSIPKAINIVLNIRDQARRPFE
jgi:hypothetical protein